MGQRASVGDVSGNWTQSTSQDAADILDAAPESYVRLDSEFRYTLVNRAAEQLLGKGRDELLGNVLWDLYPELVGTPFEENFRHAMTGRVPVTFESFFERWQRWDAIIAAPDSDGGIVVHFADITERKRTEEALRESEERHRTILQSAMDGFWVVDPQGRLLEVNDTYCRMSGYSAQELLTMNISDLKGGEAPEDPAPRIERIMAQGESRFESRHRRKDGSILDVEVCVQYRPTEGGRLVGFLRDITERKQAEERINRYVGELESARETQERSSADLARMVEQLAVEKDRAEAATRSKSEFLSSMSHEIRTPMNGVIGMTGLLLDTPLTPEQKGYAETVRGSGEALLSIINDILDFSKIEAGKLDLEIVPFDLHERPGRRGGTAGGEGPREETGTAAPVRSGCAARIPGRPRPHPAGGAQPGFERHQVHRTRPRAGGSRQQGDLRRRGVHPDRRA